ncbi:hypothetical protein CCR75_000561 [Bremia lactucae]|uniref:Uncharacterized protein n=1 Tax=Bremia lactucae TaxID=4779 RepID=A0A976IK66_BRELC|nr:hypothetical protein CCR75_000561 [Bremia lactucae]
MTDLHELKDILQLVDTKQIDHQLIKNLVEMLLLKDEKELMLRLQLAVEYNTMDTKLAKKLQSVVFNMWYHEAETFPLYKVFELTGVDFTAMKECHCIDPLEKRMMQAFLAHVKRKRREKVSDKSRNIGIVH